MKQIVTMSVDGTKMHANASKKRGIWKDAGKLFLKLLKKEVDERIYDCSKGRLPVAIIMGQKIYNERKITEGSVF